MGFMTLNNVAARRSTTLALAVVTLLAVPTWAQSASPPSRAQLVIDFGLEYFKPVPPSQLDPRITTPADRLVNRIREVWSVPIEHQSDKGLIVARLSLDKTGTVSDIVILQPSSVEGFNAAVLNALGRLNPTPLQPDECPLEPIRLTATFYYNEASTPGAIAPPGDWPPPNALQVRNDITLPRIVKEVKPKYTRLAMKAGISGAVLLTVIVQRDGTVGRTLVTRSLDQTFGLDQEAVDAAKQWKFAPGTRAGEPVDVIVTIELTFTLM